MSTPEPTPPSGPRHRPQFGMGTLMVTMAVLSVLAAGIAKLLGDTTYDRLTGVVLIVGGPMGVMIVYSLIRQVLESRGYRRPD